MEYEQEDCLSKESLPVSFRVLLTPPCMGGALGKVYSSEDGRGGEWCGAREGHCLRSSWRWNDWSIMMHETTTTSADRSSLDSALLLNYCQVIRVFKTSLNCHGRSCRARQGRCQFSLIKYYFDSVSLFVKLRRKKPYNHKILITFHGQAFYRKCYENRQLWKCAWQYAKLLTDFSWNIMTMKD